MTCTDMTRLPGATAKDRSAPEALSAIPHTLHANVRELDSEPETSRESGEEITMEKRIPAEGNKRVSSWFFQPDPQQLRQIIAGVVAGWLWAQGALRGRGVEIHLIEMTEGNDPF